VKPAKRIPDSSRVIEPTTPLAELRLTEVGKRYGIRALVRELDGYEGGERFNTTTLQLGQPQKAKR
jgi:hypothetical protein